MSLEVDTQLFIEETTQKIWTPIDSTPDGPDGTPTSNSTPSTPDSAAEASGSAVVVHGRIELHVACVAQSLLQRCHDAIDARFQSLPRLHLLFQE